MELETGSVSTAKPFKDNTASATVFKAAPYSRGFYSLVLELASHSATTKL